VGALLLACCSTALLWYAFGKSKERVEVKQEKYRIREIVTILRKNDPLLILAVAMLLNTSVWVIGNSVSLYYFKYILEREDLVGIFFGIMLPGNILGALIAPMLTKRLGKRETFILGSVVVALFYAGRYWLPSDMLALFIGMSVVGTIGQMICSVTQWAMLPDTIEYGQWKTGIRSEGIPVAFFSFTQKCGMALAGSFAAFFLSISGYVANTVQTETSLNAIRLLFTVWPGVCSAVCAVILPFYRLSEKRYEAMLSELRAEADNEEGKA